MKMIMAIVSSKDCKEITNELIKGGFGVTRISSTGGFLKSGSDTLISVVDNQSCPRAIEIIRRTTHSRKYGLGELSRESKDALNLDAYKTQEIVVGGATVFVLNVEERIKI